MSNSPSPQQVITESNKSPLIQVITWIFLSLTVLATTARIATKLMVTGSLKLDDRLALMAATAATGQSAAVLVQCTNGFGTHIDTLDQEQVSVNLKAEYAASALFIASLCLAKLSLSRVVSLLTSGDVKREVQGVSIATGLWGVSGLLSSLFQCHLPTPWDYIGGVCFGRSAFWTAFSILNILTDLAIVAVMAEAVRRIRTSQSKKTLVWVVFGSRIFVIPAAMVQIYYSRGALDSSDPMFDMWQSTLAMQVVQSLSVITACVPILKPFLDSLESGQMRADDMRRKQQKGAGGQNSDRGEYQGYRSNSAQDGSGHTNSRSRSRGGRLASAVSQRSQVHELVDLARSKNIKATITHEPATAWDGQSGTSQKGLIQQTKTWEVEVEVRDTGKRRNTRDSSTTPL